VYGYFQNRGGSCWVTRIGKSTADHDKANATLQIPSKSSRDIPSLIAQPKAELTGAIEIEVAPSIGDEPPEVTFTLRVRRGDEKEEYPNVSLSKARDTKNVVDTVNQASRLIMLKDPPTRGSLAERYPAFGTYLLQVGETALPSTVSVKSFVGDVTDRSGIEGLAIAEDATMLCCPDIMAAYEQGAIDREGVKRCQTAMIDHCESMGDRIAILDPLPGLSPQEVLEWREETNYDSKFAALYYPWVEVSGVDEKRPMPLPPSGHVAGIYARSDVHKAPANEKVVGGLNAVSKIIKGEQAKLNPRGVNCIRSFPGRGLRVWGARTLSSDAEWHYVSVRRLFNYVEKSIEHGTQWVVFEPNDEDLWARVRRDVGHFLSTVHRSGALFGKTAAEAYFVKCDAELNPPEIRDLGQLIIEVGMCAVKPAEFVIFRLSQFAGGGA
jgi:hypothetical protein